MVDGYKVIIALLGVLSVARGEFQLFQLRMEALFRTA